MNVEKLTKQYEHWLAEYMVLIPEDLKDKHKKMAGDVFSFFRGTYYLWAKCWEKHCAKETEAPKVLSTGDLHVENFGTWRDQEGRLIWGVNDFDEAAELPYTNDLVRLATSALLAIEGKALKSDPESACDAMLTGYRRSVEKGGQAFVLEAEHRVIRDIAVSELREPEKFWNKIDGLPNSETPVAQSAFVAISRSLPSPNMEFQVKSRQAGTGSLGRPRYVVVAEWEGAPIAREAKALAPSAALWASDCKPPYSVLYQTVLDAACRARDPFVYLSGSWLVRRLSPSCSKIELEHLASQHDLTKVFESMGYETANIHHASRVAMKDVKNHADALEQQWLCDAASKMAEVVVKQHGKWKAEWDES